ncbi:MAG: hypothetical protein J6J60_02555 [Clostridia bacterium]|nr:hypothetical protein [Clostridia bacterium]
MIKLSSNLNENMLKLRIIKEIKYITSYISYQKDLKDYISVNFDSISSYLENQNKNAKPTLSNNLFQKIGETKLNLDFNILNLQKLLQLLTKLERENGNENNVINLIKNYNLEYKQLHPQVLENTTNAKNLANDLYIFIKKNYKNQKELKLSEVPDFELERLENNLVLKISEKTGYVYLPYLVKDLQKIVQENPKKYSSLKDLIKKNYVIPIKYYRNSSSARFKEAYKLIRKREKGNIIEALNLAFELFLNYNLNPAIISACRNLDELDIYLDCLKDNEIEQFYCFDIIYEVPPLVKNNKILSNQTPIA